MDHFNDTIWFNYDKLIHTNKIIHYSHNYYERNKPKDYFIDDLSTITQSSMDFDDDFGIKLIDNQITSKILEKSVIKPRERSRLANIPNGCCRNVDSLVDLATKHALLYMGITLPRDDVFILMEETFRVGDEQFNAQTAVEWGQNTFPDGIPDEIVTDCVRLYNESNNNFEAMAAKRYAEILPDRLNNDRIDTLTYNNPEIDKLRDLATGMVVPVDEGFYPNGSSASTRPALQKLYKQTHLAVDYYFYKLVKQGLAFILPMALAELIPGLHISPGHWSVNNEKPQGRPLIDSSDKYSAHPVLNTPFVKNEADFRWGKIHHPTIDKIILKYMSLRENNPNVR